MLEVKQTGRFLTYVDSYFSQNEKNLLKNKCDVCRYHNLYTLHSKGNKNILEYTMISNLDMSIDELWQKIHKTTKYDIRRSKRYPVDYEEYDSMKIKNGIGFDWNNFSNMYERMFFEKNLPRVIDKKQFDNEIKAGGVILLLLK